MYQLILHLKYKGNLDNAVIKCTVDLQKCKTCFINKAEVYNQKIHNLWKLEEIITFIYFQTTF